jgi:ribosomal protein L35
MATLMRAFASYYKLKTHSGLKKRIKINGGLWEKHFMFYPVGKRHLNECKSKNNLSRKTSSKELTHYGDLKRLKRMMPYWNFGKYRG